MIGVMMATTIATTTRLLPRFGPRPLVPLGLALSAAGLIRMTALDLHSGYAADILPPLLVSGLGTGLALAPAISLATHGVGADDAGVASAVINTMQQIGGSIGVALFNTMAAGAVTTYLADHPAGGPQVLAAAGVHGYSVAYWWAAGVFAAGAATTLALYRSGPVETAPADPER
jgi:sugar phosphate permease